MKRILHARKYWPVLLLVAAQLVVATIAPSTAPVAAGGSATPSSSGTTTTAPGIAGGDTSHCVDGRQFDPAIDYYAPPCVPGTPGAAARNQGATSTGVTGGEISLVQYVPHYTPVVTALLRAEGLYYDAKTLAPVAKAYTDFINSHYELYGRKLIPHIVTGTCNLTPVDTQCVIAEFDRIVQQYHPYAMYYEGNCSACFAELARLKVVALGSSGFSRSFHTQLAPYVYSVAADTTGMLQSMAQLWCGSLANKDATYAVPVNPAQNFQKTKRQLGVIGFNDPDIVKTLHDVFYPALAKCGQSINGHEYFYVTDASTAVQQGQAGTAKMNTATDPATSIICDCDVAAPQLIFSAFDQANYWPEVLPASTMGMDVDRAAQPFRSALACPDPAHGCTYDGAFGLAATGLAQAPKQTAGYKVYNLMTKQSPPMDILSTDIFWQNYNMLASLIQTAGPNLSPQVMAAQAARLGNRGGTAAHPLRSFESGSFSWSQDFSVTYYEKGKISPQNGKPGAYSFAYNGQRFLPGHLPTGQLAVPTLDRRK